jgi:hypothetical protein
VAPFAGIAEGGIVVQVIDTQIAAGGSGFIDVTISGNGDLLESASLRLQIFPVNAVSSSLQFRDPQLVSFYSNADYLFADSSFNQLFSIDPRVVGHTILQNDTFMANDSTGNVSNIILTTSKLFARVDLQHIVPQGTDLTTVHGELFQVQVVLEGTSFRDDQSMALNNVSTGPGIVTISAVPEPSSAFLVLTLAVGTIFRRRFRNTAH